MWGQEGGRSGGVGRRGKAVCLCMQPEAVVFVIAKKASIHLPSLFPLPPASPPAAARDKLPLAHSLSLPHRFAHFVARVIRCGKCADCAEGEGSGWGGGFVPVGNCGDGHEGGCGDKRVSGVKTRQDHLFCSHKPSSPLSQRRGRFVFRLLILCFLSSTSSSPTAAKDKPSTPPLPFAAASVCPFCCAGDPLRQMC
jgi:hypothetical protein